MIVEAQVTIRAPRAAVWTALTDVERASEILSGVERIELVERPARGLVGLRWRETRLLFGKPATVEKWIPEAVEGESFTTRAESDGFVFLTSTRLCESAGSTLLTSAHDSRPQSLRARLSLPMLFLFRGQIRKLILQDLNDVKRAVEGR